MGEDRLRAHGPSGAIFWANGSGVTLCKHARARCGSTLCVSAHSPCGEKKAESQYRAGNPSMTSLPESVGCFWPSCFQVVISNMYLVRSQRQGRAAEGMAAAPSQMAFAASLHSLPRSSTHHSPLTPVYLSLCFVLPWTQGIV